MKLNFHTCLWCSHLLSVNHNSPRSRRLEQNEHFICTYVLKLVPIPAFKHLLPREDHLLQYFDLEIVLTKIDSNMRFSILNALSSLCISSGYLLGKKFESISGESTQMLSYLNSQPF